MRLRLALATLVFPVSLGALAYGCDAKAPSVQDFCGFLGNPDNCYLKFFEDIGPRCGAIGTAPAGYFVSRDKLDKCVLNDGGLITFEQAPSLTAFPPTSVAFTRNDATGATCGSFAFTGPHSYSVTIQPSLTPDGSSVKDAGPECSGAGAGGAPSSDVICGGTFESTQIDGDFVDTSCPNQETHHFISLQLDKEQCAAQKALILRYEIEGTPGGINIPGRLAVRAFYPTGETVEFFDCAIPPEPEQCCNGVKDGSETDVDCGGPLEPAAAACDRCQGSQGCVSDADCANNAPCTVGAGTGIKTCDATAILTTGSICSSTSSSSSSSSSSSGAGGAGGSGAGGN